MLCSAETDLPAADGVLGDPKDLQATVASELLDLKSSVQEILELQSRILDGQKVIHTFVQLSAGTFTDCGNAVDSSPLLPVRTELPDDDGAKGAGDAPGSQVANGKPLSGREHLTVPLKTLVLKELTLLQTLFTNSKREKTFLRRMVGSRIFELVCTVIVVLNTVLIGAVSNCEVTLAVKNPLADEELFDSCDPHMLEIAFFSFYCVELLLKFAAWRTSFFTRSGAGWNVFELGVVCAATLSFIDLSSMNVMWFRVVRLFVQLVKVLRIVRIVRFCDQLRVILISVTSSMNSFFWSLVTLALIMYICAIVLISGVTEYLKVPSASSDDLRIRAEAATKWGSIWRAMDTLFSSVTGGAPWGNVVEPLQKAGGLYYPTFLLYIAVLVIGLLKLLTGIFVQHASAASSLDREKGIQSSIEHLFQELDEDQSGSLTVEEFQAKINDPVTMAYFQMLEIDRGDIDELFSLTDVNDNNQIDIHEFIKGCQTYKGYAKKLDARYLRKQISKLTSMTESCLQDVQRVSRTPLPCSSVVSV
eukprot:TRINITY_DN12420_c0_g1_i4.p1 TRINITY_DN12420_c0_g1~~TRINITY_DN12420_c0_g1_i4.p1  ORF type:complete len:532 (+),score=93.65 TRINITY_DN12420_c0_g1_i4:39-1634(+)